MKHFVVLCDYCVDGEADVDIIGVTHTMEEAKALFEKQKETEISNAENNAYEQVEESDGFWTAYEDGDYLFNHITLRIQGA